MNRTLLTRRTVLQTGAAATAALTAPFVRGAYAAGKLSFGVWDHWVPGASRGIEKDLHRMGGKGKGRPQFRSDHLERRQGPADLDGGRPGQGRPRYDGAAHLVRLGAGRQFRAGRRYRDPVDQEVRPDRAGLPNIPARSTATGWPCRPATATARCRLAPASTT